MPIQLRHHSHPTPLSNTALEKLLARKDLGFFQIPEREHLWLEADKFGAQLRDKYDVLVVVGIGGSGLGPRVLADLFQSDGDSKGLLFCDNVDPVEFNRLSTTIKSHKQVAWLFISKSGTTIETLTALDFFVQEYGSRLTENSFVISEKKESPLTHWAQTHSRPVLEIPLDVGGRFSVLTAVGLVPARFLGLDLSEFRKGAKHAITHHEVISSFVAETLNSFNRDQWITQFWFYSSQMKNFGAWLQQLWAESLGKAQDRKKQRAPRVSSPFYQIGASDQHSVLQQSMEGDKDKWSVFTRVKALENDSVQLKKSQFSEQQFMQGKTMGQLLAAEAEATEKALRTHGVSTMTIFIDDLSPASVAEFFMFWQMVIGALGEALDINAFNQPGVELGKRLAKESLKGI